MEYAELWAIAKKWISENSGWLIALFSAAVGSIAGSWWTQRAIDERERTAAGRAELQAINRSIMLCFTIANSYLSLKRQHTYELVREYRKSQNDIRSAIAAGATGIHFSANMISITKSHAQSERLEKILLEKTNISGRALAAAIALAEAEYQLQNSITLRESLIAEFRSTPGNLDFPKIFLALPLANGNIDSRYQDCIESIDQYINDCIFFSIIAEYDISNYGRKLIKNHRRWIEPRRRTLPKVNWAPNEADSHLIPSPADYEGWTKGFIETPKWWQFWKKEAPLPLPF